RIAQTLGLVTQTLLVTVLTHALAALLLVVFCFTAFFERSHDCCSFVVLLLCEKNLVNHLVKRVFNDAFRSQGLE
ncbi:hypothetical protein, partial [Akkermansia muciniphila]|uniref:hypothetical protein n=1 Tax=Akkermansia muciniphila TaxID=239935 RepID=UPI00210E0FC1